MLRPEPEGIMEQEAAYRGAGHRSHLFDQRPGARNAHEPMVATALRFEVATDSIIAPDAPASADPDPVAASTHAAPIAFAAAAAQTPTGPSRRPSASTFKSRWQHNSRRHRTARHRGRDYRLNSADGQWWAARVPGAERTGLGCRCLCCGQRRRKRPCAAGAAAAQIGRPPGGRHALPDYPGLILYSASRACGARRQPGVRT